LTLAAQGRFDEAVAQVRLGQALEPLSLVVHHHAAWVHLLARRYNEAIAQCRSAIDMDPNFPMAHLWMVEWSRSPAGCLAGRRAIQSAAASPGARIELAFGPDQTVIGGIGR
jgi:hypothetical protein